jgi:Ca2+-dependent lipid-binding protein
MLNINAGQGNQQTKARQMQIEQLDCSPSANKYKTMRTSSPIQSPMKACKSTKQASIAHIPKLQQHQDKFIKKHQKKANMDINGRLKIAMYNNSGLLTVHVIQARQLRQTSSERCDSYVRVTMLPDHEQRLKCQTSIIKDTNNPIYDEKFSFEFSAEDLNNRMLITLWQKCYFNCTDYLIGSFSFKIKHLVKHSIVCAWY